MIIKFLLFLSFILLIIYGAHFIFYRAVVGFFVIHSAIAKSLLFASVCFLAISFTASFFLLHWQENWFSVAFYMFSAIWMGVFINLLMAAGVSGVIIGIAKVKWPSPNTALIAAICFSIAVAYSAYGIWNAFHPRFKHIDIEIENLPDQWRGKKIIQLSDVHLGHIYGVKFLNRLADNLSSVCPEVIFITGDLFDGMISDVRDFVNALNRIEAPSGVFFVTGNHETYVGLDRVLEIIGQTKITVLQNQAIEIDGLQIIGISYPGIKRLEEIRDFENANQNLSLSKPCILLYHTPTSIISNEKDLSGQHVSTYWTPDTTFRLHIKLGVSLQLSGHTHAGQIFPFGYLTKIIYNGFDHGLHRIDRFSIYTTSGVGTWGPPMRTGNSPEIAVITLHSHRP